VVALAAATSIVLAPASALAKKKHKKPIGQGPVVTVSQVGNTAMNPGTTSSASATCASGYQAVGGGFSVPYNGTGHLIVYESYRSSPDTWHVAAYDHGGSGAATAYAYCRLAVKPITDVVATGSTPAVGGGSALVDAACPPSTYAINGGFQTTIGPGGNDFTFVQESIGNGPYPGTPSPVGHWFVVALNNSAHAQTITAHAYCMGGIPAPLFKQDEGSLAAPPLGALTESSSCNVPKKPKSKKKKKRKKKAAPLLSAVAFYSPYAPGGPVVPVHTDSRIVGNSAVDTAVNAGPSTGTLTVQSQAMCF
jgi:hypothetical protein